MLNRIVSREAWLDARRALLIHEKEATRFRDRVNAERMALPWVRVEQDYVFDTPDGRRNLADLFADRSQLLVYHFMLGPDWTAGCPGCSFLADHLDGALPHLENHDVGLVVVSRARLPTIDAYKRRMGWRFPWVSSFASSFNSDFSVSFSEEQLATGSVTYNFRELPAAKAHDELPGLSAFYRDDAGQVFHTYSSYARGPEEVIGTLMLLDRAPKGRNETPGSSWPRRHDEYARRPRSAATPTAPDREANPGRSHMPDLKGQFVWFELMTPDIPAAAAFYQSVLGWSARDAGMPDRAYTVVSAGETMVGGVMEVPAGARPGWIGYVGVGDADAMAAEVKAKGGTVHREPTPIPGVGRFAVVADPQGAIFTLFEPGPGEPPPPGDPAAPGRVGWVELHAGEWTTAFSFYAGLFGWTKAEAIDMGPMGIYQLFAAGGPPLGGMMTKMSDTPAPVWRYYFNVAEIDAAATRVAEAGGQVLMGPHEVPGGSWIMHGLDPQGVAFALVAPPGSTAPR